MTGGNDISLIYPWLHISSSLLDINTWLRMEEQISEEATHSPLPSLRRYGSLDRQDSMRVAMGRRKLVQGTYCIVETVLPSQEVLPAGEQLCVLLGFRTTDDNCVDTVEADSERSQEARSWREWTGIGTLYQNLSQEETVQVVKVEFLESHVPDHAAVFHYLVLLFLQVTSDRGKVGVLDVVARFRVRNMSGYVTVYSNLSDISDDGSTASLGDMLKKLDQHKKEAKKEFFNPDIEKVKNVITRGKWKTLPVQPQE